MDLMGVSELEISWPMTRMRRRQARRSSSRRAALTSESTTRVCGTPRWRKVERRIIQRWGWLGSERRGPEAGAGELELDGGFAGLVEKAGEVELGGGLAEVARGQQGEDALGGGIEEAEARVLIEGEDGGVHFGDDAAEEGDGFEGADALGLEGIGEGVDFERKLADGVVAIGAACAEGVVLFAESGDDVGEGLDGADGFFNEGGEDEQQDEQQDAEGGEQRSGGDVEQGEDGGDEPEEDERADGAEDAEARLEGDALAFGFLPVVGGASPLRSEHRAQSTELSEKRGQTEDRSCGAQHRMTMRLDAIFFHPPVEGPAAESEGFCRLAHVAVAAREGFADEDTLHRLEGHLFEGLGGDARGGEAEVGDFDDVFAGHEDGALDGVVELADVAGPGVVQHQLQRGGVDALHLLAIALRVAGEEMRGERRNIFAALAQRRQVNLDGIEAEEEVGAEIAGFDFVRGCRRWWRRGCGH